MQQVHVELAGADLLAVTGRALEGRALPNLQKSPVGVDAVHLREVKRELGRGIGEIVPTRLRSKSDSPNLRLNTK